MTTAIDHTALAFDEIIEERMLRRDIPEDGLIVCRIMQDGLEIGRWVESDWVGTGPVAQKILAVNDLLEACRLALSALQDHLQYDDGESLERDAYNAARAAITKAEGKP